MARQPLRTLTGVELEFMHILWEKGEALPEDIRAALDKNGRNITGGSVRKILSVMESKGYVSRRKHGRSHLYTPEIGRATAASEAVGDLRDRAFGGSASLLVTALFGNGPVAPEELDAIEQLIAKHREEDAS